MAAALVILVSLGQHVRQQAVSQTTIHSQTVPWLSSREGQHLRTKPTHLCMPSSTWVVKVLVFHSYCMYAPKSCCYFYSCFCFSLSVPVNECLTNNGGCDQTCTDTADSFVCSCSSGYNLASNGLTCNGTASPFESCNCM